MRTQDHEYHPSNPNKYSHPPSHGQGHFHSTPWGFFETWGRSSSAKRAALGVRRPLTSLPPNHHNLHTRSLISTQQPQQVQPFALPYPRPLPLTSVGFFEIRGRISSIKRAALGVVGQPLSSHPPNLPWQAGRGQAEDRHGGFVRLR